MSHWHSIVEAESCLRCRILSSDACNVANHQHVTGLNACKPSLLPLFLSANDVLYTSQINDDWYSAHQFVEDFHDSTGGNGPPGNVSIYFADEPASASGCKAHYQICGPEPFTRNCTVSGGLLDIGSLSVEIGNDTESTIA